MKWTAADLPDLSGRTIVVTGATSGIGLVAARELAAHGAHVTLAVRNVVKGHQVAGLLPGAVEVRPLDIGSLQSVHAFAEAWGSRPLDILINNAGLYRVPQARTEDGFDLQFGTNYLGPFALTNLLLPKVTDRVVTLSSVLHRDGHLDFANLNYDRGGYADAQAYADSKLADLAFAVELQRRIDASGRTIRSVAAHPGLARTNIFDNLQGFRSRAQGYLANLIAQSVERGALPTLYAAVSDIPGGSYVGPGGPGEIRGYPTIVKPSAEAADPSVGARLWDASIELTSVDYPFDRVN